MTERDGLAGFLLDSKSLLTLGELSRCCGVHAEFIVEMVEEGILDPVDEDPPGLRFSGPSLLRVNRVLRLQRDLGVNLAGIALVLELMDQIDYLHSQINLLRPRD